jgi:uncharacterized Zn finger protein
MKALYANRGRLSEWKNLIARLRTTHKLKRRLMEVLAAAE